MRLNTRDRFFSLRGCRFLNFRTFTMTLMMASMALGGVFCLGCKDSGLVDTYPATGSATFNGKPMKGARLSFFPVTEDVELKRAMPKATVNEDGTFEVFTYKIGDGAPVGEYKVTIVWPSGPDEDFDKPSYKADMLNGRYAVRDQSTITVTIDANTNELEPIALQ